MSQMLTIFSAESNKQWKLHCTASSDGVRPSMRQKHSYIHVLRLSLDASLHVFSSSFSLTQPVQYTSRDTAESVVSPLPNRIYSCLGREESSDSMFAPRESPLGSMLDVWLPMRETARLWDASVFWCLCSVMQCALMLCIADWTVCYLAVISSSSTRCFISAVTLSVILTFLRLCPAGSIHVNAFFF